jgi:hypothetical protein
MAQGERNMDQPVGTTGAPLVPSRALALVRRIASPVWIRFGIAAVLEVPSRHTGTPVQVRLIPWDVDGTRYLMSQYGVTDWVRNLRAAGRGELRHKGRAAAFAAIEVDGAERTA